MANCCLFGDACTLHTTHTTCPFKKEKENTVNSEPCKFFFGITMKNKCKQNEDNFWILCKEKELCKFSIYIQKFWKCADVCTVG